MLFVGVGGQAPWGLVDAARVVARAGPGDQAVAEIATGQEGLITTPQLLCTGLGPGAIRYRRKTGRLHVVHRGVYLVGHRVITPVGCVTAAILACGPTAVVSHRSAVMLWELLDGLGRGSVHVSSATHLRPRTGLAIHRRREIHPADVRRRHRLPLTAPALTLLDLAESEPFPVLRRALNEARVRGLVDQRAFDELFERTNGRAGWSPLRQIFGDEQAPDFSRSRAEEIFWDLVKKAGLPLPRRNVRVLGHELDFYWPGPRLNVEIDGRAAHGTGLRFETDRDRDAHLASVGIRVMRITWQQLTRRPEIVIGRLSEALAAAG